MKRALPILLLTLLSGCGLFREPADELTTVSGTVRNEFDQQPVPNALVELRSCHHTLMSGWSCIYLDDTVRTDANGRYSFSFRTKKKRAYRVMVNRNDEWMVPYYADGGSGEDRDHLLAEGLANTVDLQVSFNTVLRIHLVNRNAGRNFLGLFTLIKRASTIDTTLYVRGFPRNRPVVLRGLFYNRNAAGQATDTLSVRKVITAGPRDTVDVDFGLVRP